MTTILFKPIILLIACVSQSTLQRTDTFITNEIREPITCVPARLAILLISPRCLSISISGLHDEREQKCFHSHETIKPRCFIRWATRRATIVRAHVNLSRGCSLRRRRYSARKYTRANAARIITRNYEYVTTVEVTVCYLILLIGLLCYAILHYTWAYVLMRSLTYASTHQTTPTWHF